MFLELYLCFQMFILERQMLENLVLVSTPLDPKFEASFGGPFVTVSAGLRVFFIQLPDGMALAMIAL